LFGIKKLGLIYNHQFYIETQKSHLSWCAPEFPQTPDSLCHGSKESGRSRPGSNLRQRNRRRWRWIVGDELDFFRARSAWRQQLAVELVNGLQNPFR